VDRAHIHRIANSYTSGAARSAVDTLLALDAQFAKFVFTASEPILAQMRLAWWRDRFAEPRENWPVGNPILSELASWDAEVSGLGGLVDGWEALLANTPPRIADFEAYREGRASGWIVLADHLGSKADKRAIALASARWSMADAAASMSESEARELARREGLALPNAPHLPRDLRALTVLETIGRRALESGAAPLSRPGDLLSVLRRGLTGR
jgi:15-cis-phytoene synthase